MSNSKGRVAARSFDFTDETGAVHTYEAGQRVPSKVADEVTNEKIWSPRQEDLDAVAEIRSRNTTLTDDFFEEYGGDDEETESDDDLGDLTVAQLLEYADENSVDLEGATKKADILKVLRSDAGQ